MIGIDVRNGSAEHSVYNLRDWDICYARMFQRAVVIYILFLWRIFYAIFSDFRYSR